MASLDDILTTQKNGVVAINGLNQTLKLVAQSIFATTTSATIAASTTSLITTGSGRIFGISIPVFAGASQIYVYDSATTGGIAASNLIFSSPPTTAASFTPYWDVHLTYSNGIVLKTDAGINVCVSYSPN